MWICSKLGFFSIVKKEDGCWHVRARVKEDLEALKRAGGIRERIHEWPTADYRWRLLVGRVGLGRIFRVLGYSVDYPNFKQIVAWTESQREKVHVYGNFWAGMAEVQNSRRCESNT